ncbi:MAG: AAA family ATPase [Gammaproteobacteria bacterium]|nr:AAA family ATPase [Gammaproteobacteria bacterium]
MPTQTNKLTPLDACNPALNATVSASAGSGKTWLLITRIVRLLMDGADPGNIIALTFTRKAASEMQIRLNQRLFEMATATDAELEALLPQIGCDSSEATKVTASSLYEKLMRNLHPVRIQTFHSFCQDILSRFPLEADIPPGFELIEDSSLLERQAWQMLFDKAQQSSNNDSDATELNDALDNIMQFCNGPDNTLTALRNFLSHRSDWWAFAANSTTNDTASKKQAVDFACEQLKQNLQLDENTDPVDVFINDIITQKLTVFSNLLREIKNKTSEKHADSIDEALKNTDKNTQFPLFKSAFLKKDGDTLVMGRKYSAAMEKKLGAENTDKFLALHLEIAEKIQHVNEQLKRLLTLKINKAWYFSGNRYVELYQQLKREKRLLDFTDLEWKCYQLLQHAENAHWVQYKIDQRIDHILIDEFQDTNPTQWHLLSPILEEIAANPEQRPRSVFLVGDEKQSIYSFRRANPALQGQASQWLADHLNAKATPLDFSRRSSNAIIHCVNQIFQQDEIKALMPAFTTHGTHLKTLPGQVLLCDLFTDDHTDDDTDGNTAEENEDANAGEKPFRNPLKQARETSTETLRDKEADYIAKQILQLKNTPALLTDENVIRPVDFGDIMILMRNRTHIDTYEQKLKQHGIPFIGSKKGGLLDNLEIQDLSCLLNTLITPYDNLALAQVLKSPIFNASDDDLVQLAQFKVAQVKATKVTTKPTEPQKHSAHWYQRLMQLNAQETLSEALQRAAVLLPGWQTYADHLPVHDCLDKIFSEGNIVKRYMAANRTENKQKVASNCQRFLELSLEIDAGRYPSITRFLQRLSQLKNHSDSPPEEPLSQSNESRVRLMTIHASKGLEAPIVFLADCNSTASNRNAYASLVHWPADEQQPVNFQLQLNKDNTDEITQKLQQKKRDEQAREDLNLLYVALTRAREQLYISGVASSRNQDNSWYQTITNGLQETTQQDTAADGTICRIYKHLNYQSASVDTSAHDRTDTETPVEIDTRLLKPFTLKDLQDPSATIMLAPSMHADNGSNSATESDLESSHSQDSELARWRGTIIHRLIEQLCNQADYPATEQALQGLQQQLHTETALRKPAYTDYLKQCVQEAITVYNHTAFETIFNPVAESRTYNEMPLMYTQEQQTVYGIVDRVIKTDNTVTIIDYKSHQLDESETVRNAAQQFIIQLDYYRDGIKKLWPEHTVRTGILFTHHKEIVWLE